jgi:rubrerythrin
LDGNERIAGQMEAICLAEKRHTELFDRLAKLLNDSWLDKRLSAGAQD